jgi:hypothetical protein
MAGPKTKVSAGRRARGGDDEKDTHALTCPMA